MNYVKVDIRRKSQSFHKIISDQFHFDIMIQIWTVNKISQH